MSVENELPYEHGLNTTTGELINIIHELIEDIENGGHSDIIDWDTEADRNIVGLWGYASVMTREVFDDSSHEATTVAYRSLLFSAQILEHVAQTPYKLEISQYTSELAAADSPREKFACDAAEYLQTRDHIDALIGYYMSQIDPGSQYSEIVEGMCATTFMLAERHIANAYIEATFDQIAVDDFLEKNHPRH